MKCQAIHFHGGVVIICQDFGNEGDKRDKTEASVKEVM